jgi:tetratricopeptide (TPR) repeat protein
MSFRQLAAAIAIISAIAAPTAVFAQTKRVALVVGQSAYVAPTKPDLLGFTPLANPRADAERVAALLAKNGFDVISCDGKRPGCFDLDRAGMIRALAVLKLRAAGATTALAYFAGHGLASEEGNMLTPVDAAANCTTGAIANGVEVGALIAATEPARNKIVILDACRNNPLKAACPGLAGQKLSFARIEPGATDRLLVVSSTQFGQAALDGAAGANPPFAAAFADRLAANPGIYFEQVMNDVARVTSAGAAAFSAGFRQIPGKVVGGAAPDDCLAGTGCVGDVRMAALAVENDRLAVDAAGVRNLLADEERARGKPYTAEERKGRLGALEAAMKSIGSSTDPLRQEAQRLIAAGDITGGEAKLDAALDADEQAIAAAERVAAEKRKAAAQSARDRAVLAAGKDTIKALGFYERAVKLDPTDAGTWRANGRMAKTAGRLAVAKTAFERGADVARTAGDTFNAYWATTGLGDVARAAGDLVAARRHYDAARVIAEVVTKADPGNAGWRRDLSVSYARIGDVLVAQGQLPDALKAYRDSLAIAERLAKADPGNAGWQRDLSVSYEKVGDVLRAQGQLPDALTAYRDSLAIRERLAKADPGNAGWQRDVSVSHEKVGNVLVAQGNLPDALKAYRDSLAIAERLAKADPGNAGWQRDLSVSYNKIGDVLVAQGQLPDALKAYRDSLAIRERLAKADPGNAGSQRDLSISNNLVGDVLVAQGNLPDALKAYRDSFAIAERLAKADPGNAGWQRDLSVAYNKIGDVLEAQGQLPDALKAYRDSLAIAERLAKADPGNAGWKADLAASDGKLGQLHVALGDKPEALRLFKAGRAIVAPLAGTGHQLWTGYLQSFDEDIAELEK